MSVAPYSTHAASSGVFVSVDACFEVGFQHVLISKDKTFEMGFHAQKTIEHNFSYTTDRHTVGPHMLGPADKTSDFYRTCNSIA